MKMFAQNIVGRLTQNRFVVALIALALIVLTSPKAQAAYTIVSADSNGEITFTPGGMITPIITGVVAGVVSAAGLVVLWVGVRWLFRTLKGSK